METQELTDSGISSGGEPVKVKVDGEDATLFITEHSVMFAKGGKINGFERSAIRMMKPDGEGMMIAYSAGSEVKSVRVEPITAVASLMLNRIFNDAPSSGAGLDEVFETLYRDTKRDLEGRLAKVQSEPETRSLRLTPEEAARYSQISKQMENIVNAKYHLNSGDEDTPISFWGLEKQPYELQLAIVKIHHIRFLRMVIEPLAERNDIAYSTDEVWPEDWPGILERFGLESGLYSSEAFIAYVRYLKSHWKYRPGTKKPVLARS